MSSPSSSRLKRAAYDDILTPSKRVKALLAQFDDSESDTSPQRSASKAAFLSEKPNVTSPAPSEQESDGEDEDELLPFAPRGRLASRLQADPVDRSAATERPDDAYHRLKQQLRDAKGSKSPGRDNKLGSETDTSGRPSHDQPPRRRLQKTDDDVLEASASIHERSSVSPPARQPSSDGSSRSRKSKRRESPGSKDDTAGKSRFLALVDKHRRLRLEKEQAEKAKRAAREKEFQSQHSDSDRQSILNDSEEESDASRPSVQKLTQQARPTRKASKKALEEMSRETQRMSRNMQLAHQARTKKKITKESLLARFGFSLPGQHDDQAAKEPGSASVSASSARASDSEAQQEHVTPPTSPVSGSPPTKTQAKATASLHDLDLLQEPADVMINTMHNAITVQDADLATEKPNIAVKAPMKPIRVKISRKDISHLHDSDSDLEIITSKSKTRKFAVFEALPRRKAQEAGSHIALRSLAHIGLENDKTRSSINSVDMDRSLRKAARMQALREREAKIEELRAKGVVIQTSEERERDQQEVEDLVERARQEAAEIQRREKLMAKKDGTFVKDGLDDDDSEDDEDEEFAATHTDEDGAAGSSDDDEELDQEEDEGEDENEDAGVELQDDKLIDDEASQQASGEEESGSDPEQLDDFESDIDMGKLPSRRSRIANIISDDEDVPLVDEIDIAHAAKTPQSAPRSNKKVIPGLVMSDDLPIGLTQAFAATMADSQTQQEKELTQENRGFAVEIPSPGIHLAPRLNRMDSLDMISDSQPASQALFYNTLDATLQPQNVPESPSLGLGISGTPVNQSQFLFEATQDAGYLMSPFHGSRFAVDTPSQSVPHSTVDTVIVPAEEDSPILQRKARLVRGRDTANTTEQPEKSHVRTAFDALQKAAKHKSDEPDFDRKKSAAKEVIDEAADESEDEYAGLGGASDDEEGEVDEEDRKMIDEETHAGKGDAEQFAGIYADRERKQDEAAVSKLLKDITTGALRRKRGVGDDLDLSDEEDATARRREAKRREFAKMRRELFKNEAVSKIAEDRKKEAFLRSIEDREEEDDDDDEVVQDTFDRFITPLDDSQSQTPIDGSGSIGNDFPILVATGNAGTAPTSTSQKRKLPFDDTSDSQLNSRLPPSLQRTATASLSKVSTTKRPTTLAEIRDSVSFLIEEPDAHSATIDLGLSDSEDEPEAYVNLDRHLLAAEADENALGDEDEDDLGDFVVDDEDESFDAKLLLERRNTDTQLSDSQTSQSQGNNDHAFKKPRIPSRAPFSQRRTDRAAVVDRLALIRQNSSSSTISNASSSGGKMAFHRTASLTSISSGGGADGTHVPTLLRRATTNSSFSSMSFGSMSGRLSTTMSNTSTNGAGDLSATGVSTNNMSARANGSEKEFVRKANTGRRMAVNFDARAEGNSQGGERAKVGKMKAAGVNGKRGLTGKTSSKKSAGAAGFMGGLFRGDSWE